MWKAKIVKNVVNDGRLTVGVQYSDGSTSFRENIVDLTGLLDVKTTIENRLTALAKLGVGHNIQEGDTIASKPHKPAQNEPAIDTGVIEFRKKFSELRDKIEYVNMGLLSDEDVAELRNEVISLGKEVGKL